MGEKSKIRTLDWVIYIIGGLIIFGFLMYFAENMLDRAIIAIVVVASTFAYWMIDKHLYKKKHGFLSIFLIYVIAFADLVIINRHLLYTVKYLYFIPIIMTCLRFSFQGKEQEKAMILGNLVGLVFVCSGFYMLDQDFDGISKQEHYVQKYIAVSDDSDRAIEEMYVGSEKNDLQRVIVTFKDDKNSFNVYSYKDEEIVKVQTITY